MATQKMDSWEDPGQTSNVTMMESWSIMTASNWDFSITQMSHFKTITFYVVETRTHKDIIVRHAASSRLGLIQVLCKNVSKSVSTIENKTNTSSRDSFQDHCLKIDGKMSQRNQGVALKSFQDHPPSSFKTMAMCTCTETFFKTPANTQGRNEQNRHKLTPFKTLECRWHMSHQKSVHWNSFQGPSQHMR